MESKHKQSKQKKQVGTGSEVLNLLRHNLEHISSKVKKQSKTVKGLIEESKKKSEDIEKTSRLNLHNFRVLNMLIQNAGSLKELVGILEELSLPPPKDYDSEADLKEKLMSLYPMEEKPEPTNQLNLNTLQHQTLINKIKDLYENTHRKENSVDKLKENKSEIVTCRKKSINDRTPLACLKPNPDKKLFPGTNSKKNPFDNASQILLNNSISILSGNEEKPKRIFTREEKTNLKRKFKIFVIFVCVGLRFEKSGWLAVMT